MKLYVCPNFWAVWYFNLFFVNLVSVLFIFIIYSYLLSLFTAMPDFLSRVRQAALDRRASRKTGTMST